MYYYLLPLHCLQVHSGSWNQYHQQPEALQCIPEKKQQFTLKFTPEETINLFSILQGFCIVGGHLILLSFLTDHEVVSSSSSADLPYNKRRKKRTNKAQKQASESQTNSKTSQTQNVKVKFSVYNLVQMFPKIISLLRYSAVVQCEAPATSKTHFSDPIIFNNSLVFVSLMCRTMLKQDKTWWYFMIIHTLKERLSVLSLLDPIVFSLHEPAGKLQQCFISGPAAFQKGDFVDANVTMERKSLWG